MQNKKRTGQKFPASTKPIQEATKKQTSFSAVLPYVYVDGNDSFQKAIDRFGGPQDLLRSASEILAEASSAADSGNNPKAAGNDEIRALTQFAQGAGLMMNADVVRDYFFNHPMIGGTEHRVAHSIESEQVLKDLDAHAIGTESIYDYLTDLELSNHYFEDDIKLEGFYQFHGRLHIIISQPFRRGVHPELDAMKTALENQGFKSESPTGSTGVFNIHDEKIGDISIIDVKPDNVVWDESLSIAWPVDVHFYFDSREDRRLVLETLRSTRP